jgi:phenylacetate-CoA ligase
VQGRWDSEALIGVSGQRIPIAAVNLHSRAYTSAAAIQFIQHENGRATVFVVPTHAFDQQAADSLLGQLQEKLGGEMKFSIERVDELQKTPAGKTPWVINRGTSFHE